jgi:nitrous oxidase accessory protein NosD
MSRRRGNSSPSATSLSQIRPGYVARPPGDTPIYVPEPPVLGDVDASELPEFPLVEIPFDDSSSRDTFPLQPGVGSFASAINSASPGSTVIVPPGIYTESFEVTKSLNFLADGEVTIIGDGTADVVTVNSPGVTFEGFSIEHSAKTSRAALVVNSGTLSLVNCRIKSKSVAAIQTQGDARLKLLACDVIGVGPISAFTGIGDSELIAEQCFFSESKSAAVSLTGRAVAKFTQCLFHKNSRVAISAIEGTRIFVHSCQFIDCQIELSNSGSANIITATTLERPGMVGVSVEGTTTLHFVGNILSGSRVEVKDRSKLTLTRNEFIDGSLVAWGESEVSSNDDSFKGETPAAVGVFGDAVLTMSKLTMEDIEGCGVVIYEDSKLILEEGTISACGITGVMAHSGAKIVLRNVEILDCGEVGLIATDTKETVLQNVTLDRSGRSGAELCRARQCKITESKFNGNGRCGIIIVSTAATIEGGEFTNNQFSGIHAGEATVDISNSVITTNHKTGIYATKGTTVNVADTPFSSNEIAAISVDSGCTVEVTNSDFEENEIGIIGEGTVTLRQCKFKRHTEAAILATGQVNCDKCEWSEEAKVAVSVVSGTQFNAVRSTFANNNAHIEASGGGSVMVQSSEFTASQGNAGVHINAANATFSGCKFTDDKAVAVFSEGNTTIDRSTISGAGRAGIVFDGKAQGKVSNSTISGNGEVGCQCFAGTPHIINSEIKEHARFGIYIFKGARVVASGLTFDENKVANIWRE